jgi:FkbM family methyltransferase
MRQRYIATVPLWLESPSSMRGSIAQVFAGEYESGFSGEGLTILDIGANVGAFSLWADMRWPGSTIHAYEPHPETFRIFQRNVALRKNIIGRNAAVSAAGASQGTLLASYVGDGEAMLSEYREATFNTAYASEEFTVDLIHPSELPQADVVKLDVEGAEADIIEAMDMAATSLVVLEYQNDRNRNRILRFMEGRFSLVRQDAFPWRDLFDSQPAYNRALRADHWGHLAFFNSDSSLGRLTQDPPPDRGRHGARVTALARRVKRFLGA